jgi:DNA topoisomerase-3
MTALWETQLEKISSGEFPEDQFMRVLFETLQKRVNQFKDARIVIRGMSVEPIKGDGTICPACNKGTMRTKVLLVGEKKERKIVLSCDSYNKDDPNTCRNTVWPDSPKSAPVPPAPGHGKPCSKCKIGIMVTKKSAKGTVYLGCNNWKGKDAPDNCDHYEFVAEPITDLPGTGDICDKCNKGRMRTRKSFNGDNAGSLYLACDAYPTCKNTRNPEGSKGKPSSGTRNQAKNQSAGSGSRKTGASSGTSSRSSRSR